MKDKPDVIPYHLFFYGKNLGLQRGGKTLFVIQGVDMWGSTADGKTFSKGEVESCGAAHFRIMLMANPNLNAAYYWTPNSNTLIEKPPEKRTGKWATNNGCLFIWADEVFE